MVFRHFHLIIRMVASLCLLTGLGAMAAHAQGADSDEVHSLTVLHVHKWAAVATASSQKQTGDDTADLEKTDQLNVGSVARRDDVDTASLTLDAPIFFCVNPDLQCKDVSSEVSGVRELERRGFSSRAPPAATTLI